MSMIEDALAAVYWPPDIQQHERNRMVRETIDQLEQEDVPLLPWWFRWFARREIRRYRRKHPELSA